LNEVQEQHRIIENQQIEIALLKAQNETLAARLARPESRVVVDSYRSKYCRISGLTPIPSLFLAK
jgi:hypothetical protein